MESKEFVKTLNAYAKEGIGFLFVVSYKCDEFFICRLDNLPPHLEFEFGGESKSVTKTPLLVELEELENYKKKFDTLQEELKAGNTYLANLTLKTPIKTHFSLEDIYKKSNAKFKLRYKNFVCFSPERFVKIQDDKIYTTPMKGTINAHLPNAKEILINDKKEIAEHTMVVDLLRNDLSKVASHVRVEKFRYVERVEASELLQTSSLISGKLDSNWRENLGEILLKLLPAGSITGTPKKSTVEILEKLEGYERGFYCGVFGVFDGESLDSAVMIRFIEQEGEHLYYKSGGGITCESDARSEYDEVRQKIYLPF